MNEWTKIWINELRYEWINQDMNIYTKIWINNLNMNELNKDLSEQWLP